MTRAAALLLTLAVLALARPAGADSLQCVVVRDSNGQPSSTVCVPGPAR